MASNKTFPAVIHIRDFIERVKPDPTQPSKGLTLQLYASLNIPERYTQSDNIKQRDVPALVRFFSESN